MNQITNHSIEELGKIFINIPDKNVPIVFFIGPNYCGKSLALIRLCYYINFLGYHVFPIEKFRIDKYYKHVYNYFVTLFEMMHNYNNLSTFLKLTEPLFNFALIEVMDLYGKRICYLFETPYEHFSLINSPLFPPYLIQLFSAHNPKKMVYFFDSSPELQSYSDKNKYTELIRYYLKNVGMPQDKTVFLYNKIDKKYHTQYYSKKLYKQTIFDFKNENTELIAMFKPNNPILKMLKPYLFSFIPFSFGTFTYDKNRQELLTWGDDSFPKNLWNIIK